MSSEPMQQARRRPTNKDMPKIIKKLMKIPVEPPCDACPWRLWPDKVQGCDNCGCGYMYLYMAVKRYQREEGHGIHKAEDQKDEVPDAP